MWRQELGRTVFPGLPFLVFGDSQQEEAGMRRPDEGNNDSISPTSHLPSAYEGSLELSPRTLSAACEVSRWEIWGLLC